MGRGCVWVAGKKGHLCRGCPPPRAGPRMPAAPREAPVLAEPWARPGQKQRGGSRAWGRAVRGGGGASTSVEPRLGVPWPRVNVPEETAVGELGEVGRPGAGGYLAGMRRPVGVETSPGGGQWGAAQPSRREGAGPQLRGRGWDARACRREERAAGQGPEPQGGLAGFWTPPPPQKKHTHTLFCWRLEAAGPDAVRVPLLTTCA